MPLVDVVRWRERKGRMLSRLREDLEIGYLDKDIVDVLLKLFEFDGLYTISSCSGRVTLIDGDLPWRRKGSTIIFKKHQPLTLEELLSYLEGPVSRRLWLVVTGPIIHASAVSLGWAGELLRIARESGMKHSGVLSISRGKGVIVELRTGVRLTSLLKIRDQTLIGAEKVEEVVRVANEALLEGKEKLERLRKALERASSTGLTGSTSRR
ncbi:MAG: hypothetical protein QXS42_04440 [Zestosphaera sp.]